VAPIAGAVVFRAAGAQVANAMQPTVCAAALVVVLAAPLLMKTRCTPGSSSIPDALLANRADSCPSDDSCIMCVEGSAVEDSACPCLPTENSKASLEDLPAAEGQDQGALLLRCLRNGPLTAQLTMLVLTQFARCLITVLLPQALSDQEAWLVPAAFAVQVGGLSG